MSRDTYKVKTSDNRQFSKKKKKTANDAYLLPTVR